MAVLPTDRHAITQFFNLIFRFDVKRVVDSGEVAALSTDANGTLVTFNRPFKDIDSITASVREITDFNVVVNFVDTPNPVNFRVLVFTTGGARSSKTVYWMARGVV